MRVVEVCSSVVDLRMDFVVKALVRCNGPLGDRRTVAERGGALGETMPMLEIVSIYLEARLEDLSTIVVL